MILTNEYLGRVSMTPISHVVAGEIGSWTLTYVVGKYGIDDTGSIKIAWRNPSDWEMPQFKDPTARGYTTVSHKGNACLAVALETFERPFNNSLLIRVYDGFLTEGDSITVVFGDRSAACPTMSPSPSTPVPPASSMPSSLPPLTPSGTTTFSSGLWTTTAISPRTFLTM